MAPQVWPRLLVWAVIFFFCQKHPSKFENCQNDPYLTEFLTEDGKSVKYQGHFRHFICTSSSPYKNPQTYYLLCHHLQKPLSAQTNTYLTTEREREREIEE